MITLTATQLMEIMPLAKSSSIFEYLPRINRCMAEFEINTELRVVYYLATIAVESGELKYIKELSSGKQYEGRKNLGNVNPGDGVKFVGRGLIQLTGRTNYESYKKFCGFDVVAMPQLLEKPYGATRSSCWFFQSHGCNQLADKDDLEGVRKRVNGGLNGIKAFRTYVNRAKRVICKNGNI